jgi:hypothetical protein
MPTHESGMFALSGAPGDSQVITDCSERIIIAHTHSGGVVWAETTFQISTRGGNQIALIFVSALQVKISQIRRRCVWARNYVGHYIRLIYVNILDKVTYIDPTRTRKTAHIHTPTANIQTSSAWAITNGRAYCPSHNNDRGPPLQLTRSPGASGG